LLDVRDAPALPDELRAAMVTWLPVMSAGIAADVLCAVSCLAAGLLQDIAYRRLQRVVRSPILTSSLAFWHSGIWAVAVRQVLLGGQGTLGLAQLSSPS